MKNTRNAINNRTLRMVNGDLCLVAATAAVDLNLLPRSFYNELEVEILRFEVASLYNINKLITNQILANIAVVMISFYVFSETRFGKNGPCVVSIAKFIGFWIQVSGFGCQEKDVRNPWS